MITPIVNIYKHNIDKTSMMVFMEWRSNAKKKDVEYIKYEVIGYIRSKAQAIVSGKWKMSKNLRSLNKYINVPVRKAGALSKSGDFIEFYLRLTPYGKGKSGQSITKKRFLARV